MMALEVSNVQLDDIIEDAARREQVLHDFEALQQQIFQNYKAARQQQNQETQAEIESLMEQLRGRIEASEKELASEKARLDEWRSKKREEERRIKGAVSHFGTSNEGNGGAVSGQRPSSSQAEAPATGAPVDHSAGRAAAAARPSMWKR
jgi:hypothetical protein